MSFAFHIHVASDLSYQILSASMNLLMVLIMTFCKYRSIFYAPVYNHKDEDILSKVTFKNVKSFSRSE